MDSENQFSDRKRCRDDNPEPSPSPDQKKKRRSKKKNKGVLDPQDPEPEVLNADPPGYPEPKKTKEKGAEPNEGNVGQHQVCPKQESAPPLDIAVSIVPEKKTGSEPNETAVEHLLGVCHEHEPALLIDPEKKTEAAPNEATAEQPGSLPVPDPTPVKDSPLKKKWKRKTKGVLNSQGTEPSEPNPEPEPASPAEPAIFGHQEKNVGTGTNEATAGHPEMLLLPLSDQVLPRDSSQKKKRERKKNGVLNCQGTELAPPADTAIPIVPEKKEGAGSNESTAEYTQECSRHEPTAPVDPAIPVDPGKKKGAEQNEATAGHFDPLPVPDPTPPIDPPQKRKQNKKRKSMLNLQGEANAEQPPVCSKPEPARLVDIAFPIDREKKRGAEPNEATAEYPELLPVLDPTTPNDSPLKKKRKKKKKSVLNCQVTEPNEASVEHPEVCPRPEPALPVDRGIPIILEKKEGPEPNEATAEHPQVCPRPDPAHLIDPAIPENPEKKNVAGPNEATEGLPELLPVPDLTAPRKKKSVLNHVLNQTQPEPAPPLDPAIPVCPKPTPPIGQTIPTDPAISLCPEPAPPIGETTPGDPAIPTDPEQKTLKKKRKKKRKCALKIEGAEPNEHNAEPPETLVQRSICPLPAPPLDPRIPVDPEQNTMKKKRKKKRKNVLQSEGTEPSEYNAEPPAESLVLRTKGLTITKVPFKRRGETNMKCRACRQLGHKFLDCPRLKCLTADDEICFFCGEIGHSLGKCSVSLAGGGRFAKCLFCYAHGHFSNNCPQNGHGIDSKVVAASGPTNTIKVETEERFVAEVTNVSSEQ